MMQSNSQPGGPGSAEFRLMTTTLEKALSAVRDKKQSRKLGRYEMDTVHRIQVRITLFLIVGEVALCANDNQHLYYWTHSHRPGSARTR
jgi:hypothetical protein